MNGVQPQPSGSGLTGVLAGRLDFTEPTPLAADSGRMVAHGNLRLLFAGVPNFQDGSAADFLAAVEACHWQDPTPLLARVRGPFALALADIRERRLLLAVDRLGIMPLAWRREEGRILFASLLDDIRRQSQPPLALDLQAVFDYVYFHMIPAPGTIYQGVQKLEPASYVLCDRTGTTQGGYWRIPYREAPLDRLEAQRQLQTLVEEAVAANLDAEPAGAFLSGGLDSSTACGFFRRHATLPHRVFSVGFDAEGYDETPWARAAAEHFGLQLETYYVTPEDVMAAVPEVAAAYDEPFGNASAIPAYFCARQARAAGIGCLLAGDGGDELFAGNARYAKQLRLARYERLPARLRQGLIEPLVRRHGTLLERIPLGAKAASYVRQASLPMPQRMESYNLLLRAGIERVFTPEFLDGIDPHGPDRRLQEAYRHDDPMSLLKHMLALDMKITLADNDLRKVSHMCRLAGIDVRYPMLEERLVEFAAGLPSGWLLEKGELRSFYRRSFADFLPQATLEKRKHGFGLPFGVWAAEHAGLAALADESLSRLAARGWIRADYIEELRQRHGQEHAAYYGVMVWVLVMLESWLAVHNY